VAQSHALRYKRTAKAMSGQLTLNSIKVIKTVIFDLGKVIVPFDFKRGYRAMAELCPYAAEDIPKRIGSTDLVRRYRYSAPATY